MTITADRDEILSSSKSIDDLCRLIHARNIEKGWWKTDENGIVEERNIGELLALVHSEVSEALEGFRKDLPDDKLPQYPMGMVELIDVLVRTFDILGREMFKTGLSSSEIFMDKIDFNAVRADHLPENREKLHGKKF